VVTVYSWEYKVIERWKWGPPFMWGCCCDRADSATPMQTLRLHTHKWC